MSEPTRTHGPDPRDQTRTAAPDADALTVEGGCSAPPAGYELHSLLGQGGMGIVYRARELTLDRDVAIKILHSRYPADSAAAARFLDEARITGQLQHPGIPPIHHVGTLPDGRPFLGMKLIKGRTLDELLKERTSPAADRGRFLAIFEQICQAVGFAHDRKVIHRDLKPSNVMVGAFGEVQVMDWGLAKVIRSAERGVRNENQESGLPSIPHSEFRTPHSDDRTQAGSLLGTPAYMPPEQAIGAVNQIDERADVFGLGAILCVILTGNPPYSADDPESTRQLAARGKLEDAYIQLAQCGAEPEVIALARRCLAAEPAGRPRDAGALAAAMAALRADAEQRLRQAEMDRARAEVKSAEERKRRHVQRALALAVLGLVAVAGVAAWWIEHERSQRRADEQAEQLKREAEFHARQLATERDVVAALNEVQLLLKEGRGQSDNPDRWAMTLLAAHSSLKRAESLLASGEPTEDLRTRVAAASTELVRDSRDRALLEELDLIADTNDIRMIIPITFSDVTSRRFETAFQGYGVEPTEMPVPEAVAWVKNHRFRDRIATALRTWRANLPFDEGLPGYDGAFIPVFQTSSAGASVLPIAAFNHRTHRPTNLDAILDAVTEDPFAREWWAAVKKRNTTALKAMIARPEMRKLSSRELAALADGLTGASGTGALNEFLELAYERFPGEFWVHFRLAMHEDFSRSKTDPESEHQSHMIRHLTAAVAARPNSALARVVLGIALLEKNENDAVGHRMIRTAMELDPKSAWPHLFLAISAAEKGKWAEVYPAFKNAVRADPDTSFLMISGITSMGSVRLGGQAPPSERELAQFLAELIEARPDHPGGHDLLGGYHMNRGDHRAALASFRKARTLNTPGYPGRAMSAFQMKELEAEARWEPLLPAVLRGELKPKTDAEVAELAGYCANFEKNYVLAVRFVREGIAANPKMLEQWNQVARYAGWAVQAGSGNGIGAEKLTADERAAYRRQALSWLRECIRRAGDSVSIGYYLGTLRSFDPVRDPKQLAKLPPDERAEWERFWKELDPSKPSVVGKPIGKKVVPVAPMPREKNK